MSMKLNNKGWGTLEMVLISLALLVMLIVSIYFISRLYGSFDNSKRNKVYMDLETKLAEAARIYVRINNIDVTSNYRISYETLKEANLIRELKDSSGNDCEGYALISILSNKKYYNGYVSCNNYTSKNY